ncbi:MAG: tetratricopeptide repeat protein [Planctomycetia bacterium]|nr:tetratricopeptide repeat protein [Planctomycetia bacterium]
MLSRHEVVILFSLISVVGCRAPQARQGYQTSGWSSQPDASAAELNRRGVRRAEAGDFDGAEEAFRAALAVSPGLASAHNNLGLVLVERRALYEAALEFKMASRLAPEAVEPYMNLARLYESVGWLKESAASYRLALSCDPENVPAMGRLASVLIRSGRDIEAGPLLSSVAAAANTRESLEWRAWAIERLSLAN